MTNAVRERVASLLREVAKGKISADRAIGSSDWRVMPAGDAAWENAWHALQHYAADADIRRREPDYAARQIKTLLNAADRLAELSEDPG